MHQAAIGVEGNEMLESTFIKEAQSWPSMLQVWWCAEGVEFWFYNRDPIIASHVAKPGGFFVGLFTYLGFRVMTSNSSSHM